MNVETLKMFEGLIGVIIGAILAIVGGVIGNIILNRHNKKMMYLNEKKETYEAVYEIIYDLTYNKMEIKQNQKEFDNKCKKTASKLMLYAPKEILVLFVQVLDFFDESVTSKNIQDFPQLCERLNKAMRKDLEI